MSVAPERIWAWKTANCDGDWTIAEGQGIPYVRADIHADLTAERDALLEALVQLVIEYDEVDLAHAEPKSLTAAVNAARAALKGQTSG